MKPTALIIACPVPECAIRIVIPYGVKLKDPRGGGEVTARLVLDTSALDSHEEHHQGDINDDRTKL